ncbi:unnamed protein product [Trichobilharzia szidati]|nr:unnamed protein product [Trichobilharzia szidati]
MGNSNNRFSTLQEYDDICVNATEKKIQENEAKKSDKCKTYFNGTVRYDKITETNYSPDCLDHSETENNLYSVCSPNPCNYSSSVHNTDSSIHFDIERCYDQNCTHDSYYYHDSNEISQNNRHVNNDCTLDHIMHNSSLYKSSHGKNVCLTEMRRFYVYLTRHLFKSSHYLTLKTNCPVESSISTAPINIRSALPRGYYPSSTSSLPRNTKSSYHDQNTRNRRGSINPVEVPQLYDSMNEIQHLRSQLNMLSKLIESDGSNANRTPPAFRATASKSTQTELGYLLDRHTKKSTAEITELKGIIKIKEETIKLLEEENARLSDSLKSILHNMNKPNNLDKNTMSNNLNKTNQNQLDAYEQKINRSITNSQTKPYDSPRHSHPYNLHEQQQQQQQQFRQNQQRYQQPHRQTYTPVNQSPPVTISHSPSQKCYMMRSYTSESSPNTNTNPSPYGLDISSSSPPFTSSPINRQSSPDKYSSNSNIRRQLSPTGKRFPYYQPYIHSLMHPNQTSKYDKNKNSNDLKGIGYSLTAAQSQIVKSPTQRLLMQSLPSSGY